MRFHVVSLPHTQTTRAFSVCAYTEKVRKFCMMMKALGHTVYLYAGEKNEAPCDELVTCIGEDQRAVAAGPEYVWASFDASLPHWRAFNAAAAAGIKARAQPRDFVCVIAGIAHKPIADALPDMMTVEFGIGYGGTFAKFRVFESYAWMHTVYGAQSHNNPHSIDGQWFDAVIPGYLDPADFPFRSERNRDDYFLFVGRLTERKGYTIAQEVCQRLGKRLLLAGPGIMQGYGEHVGVIGPEERGRLMSGARALFAPTIYVEPFGNVAIEAMACGTPVIATDWGAFTETVVDGVTGFRCRTLSQFMDAATKVGDLDAQMIRRRVVQNYSLDAVGRKYHDYFERLSSLWGDGWYAHADRAAA